MGHLREWVWFEKGELAKFRELLTLPKFAYEARWEVHALAPMLFGLALAFSVKWWVGLAYLWLVKNALQSMLRKRFFDPIDSDTKRHPPLP